MIDEVLAVDVATGRLPCVRMVSVTGIIVGVVMSGQGPGLVGGREHMVALQAGMVTGGFRQQGSVARERHHGHHHRKGDEQT